jgi:excisionase family DNA binding protein
VAEAAAQTDQKSPFASAVNARVNELRLAHPEIRDVSVDLLFVSYLLAAGRFGRVEFGPISIDASVVEELFLRQLVSVPTNDPHRMQPGAHAFYRRLAAELERAGTGRANELHYLLAFMRTPEGLPARVFGELGVTPEAVEAFAREPARPERRDVFLTPEDVAKRLGVNVQTVRAWVRSGKLPASRLAGQRILRIREADIEKVLEPVDPGEFT